MRFLLQLMTHDDPTERPTAEQCAYVFDKLFVDIPRTVLFSSSLRLRALWRIRTKVRDRAFWSRELALYLGEVGLLVFRGMQHSVKRMYTKTIQRITTWVRR